MAASSVGVHIFKRVPVIVVIGATGTGKSKLALEIALKYGGQVISADSMQVSNRRANPWMSCHYVTRLYPKLDPMNVHMAAELAT